jgi:hypothetical protein
MKVILKFNLPEEETEFNDAIQGSKLRSVFWEMDQWLRGLTKYAPDDMSPDSFESYTACREKLRELMRDENINI